MVQWKGAAAAASLHPSWTIPPPGSVASVTASIAPGPHHPALPQRRRTRCGLSIREDFPRCSRGVPRDLLTQGVSGSMGFNYHETETGFRSNRRTADHFYSPTQANCGWIQAGGRIAEIAHRENRVFSGRSVTLGVTKMEIGESTIERSESRMNLGIARKSVVFNREMITI